MQLAGEVGRNGRLFLQFGVGAVGRRMLEDRCE